jgi:hypothetical protein
VQAIVVLAIEVQAIEVPESTNARTNPGPPHGAERRSLLHRMDGIHGDASE